jgi:cell division protein FtsN
MTRDYKKPTRAQGSRGGGSSFLAGMLVGLVLGLGIALGVAWYINKLPSPFLPGTEPARDRVVQPAPRTEKPAPTAEPRFDFYKILPGHDEPATEQQLRDAQKSPATAQREAFFLQAGAFQNAPDADNLKARLALVGIEATIQTTTLPDKGVWHRVCIGPYTSIEELNRTRDTLKQNGVETTLIRVRGNSTKR